MRTQGVYQQDTPVPDGILFIPVTAAMDTTASATASVTSGVVTATVAATATATFYIDLAARILARYGVQDYSQEQWGSTAAGGANFLPTPPATFTAPFNSNGNPPFTGATQFNNLTSRPKGIQINGMNFIYKNLTATITANSVALNKVVFANNVAPATTAIPLTGALSLTVQTTGPSVTPVTVTTPTFLTALNACYPLVWTVTGSATGSAVIYGVELLVSYNYN